MKKTYLLLLLLSAASLNGFAQESQSDLLFRFVGTTEEESVQTEDERIEETKELYAKIKEIRAVKKANLMSGLAAGMAAVASGIEASKQQQAANDAARAEEKAQYEQRIAASRAQQQSGNSATRSTSASSSSNEQSIKNRANSMAAQDARNSSAGVNQYQLASIYENLIRQYPNYNDAQIRQLARGNQGYSQSQSTSTNVSTATDRIIQCVVVNNGTLTAAKLRVSASGVVNGYTFGGKGGVNNDYNWTPALQNFIPVQTRDVTDGNIAREYGKKINVGNYTFYFN